MLNNSKQLTYIIKKIINENYKRILLKEQDPPTPSEADDDLTDQDQGVVENPADGGTTENTADQGHDIPVAPAVKLYSSTSQITPPTNSPIINDTTTTNQPTVKLYNSTSQITQPANSPITDDTTTTNQTPAQQPPQRQETPEPTPELKEIRAWYRFPQLNGGFFEMADSLLDSNKMTNIQDPNRKYKQYEKKGAVYGLINTQGTADTASAQSILEFFKGKAWIGYVGKLASFKDADANLLDKIGKIINGYTKRELGRILDEFFKNRMVKVGEYYCIDDAFLLYCCLIAMQQAGIKVKDQLTQAYQIYVTDRAPKIVKAKFKPEDLPKDVTNADNAEKISPQKLTIKQMFKGRADKNLANYNNIRKNNMAQKDAYNSTTRPGTGGVYGDDTQSDAEFENYKKNINRSNRERIYR